MIPRSFFLLAVTVWFVAGLLIGRIYADGKRPAGLTKADMVTPGESR